MAQAAKKTAGTQTNDDQVIKKLVEEVEALKAIVQDLNERIITLKNDTVNHVNMYNDHIRRLHM